MNGHLKPRGAKLVFYAVALAFTAGFIWIYAGVFSGSSMFTHDSATWMGAFYYYAESLSSGVFPFWDPYSLTGTPFYPNLHALGLLDPTVVLPVAMIRFFGATLVEASSYLYLLRLFIFALGGYYLFKQISGCKISALMAAFALLYAVTPPVFKQHGILDHAFLAPLSMYFLLKTLHHSQDRRKYVYLAALAAVVGIALNVNIPAYFSFNLLCFILLLFAAGFLRFKDLKNLAGKARSKAYIAVVALLLLLSAAPSFTLFMESKGAQGEHFPSLRIIQKNGYTFKKIVASDVTGDILSSKFTKNLGVYSTPGNLLNLAYPDMALFCLWDVTGFNQNGRGYGCRISEGLLYIGIIPFVIAVIGFITSKSRYRWICAAMLVLVAVNMVSFSGGVDNVPPNAVQTFFSRLFPPLGMMDVRESLSGFFLLYVCALFALGFKKVLESSEPSVTIAAVSVSFAVLLLKVLTTRFYFGMAVYVSYVDLAGILALFVFAALMVLRWRKILGAVALAAFLAALTAADLFYYDYALSYFVTQDNLLDATVSEARRGDSGGFALFRAPFVNIEPLAFSEAVFKEKGAMSRGNNHHFLTTKRYYDYFTNVPLANQFILSGITTPLVRFYPEGGAVTLTDRREVLERISLASEGELKNSLFLEAKEAAPKQGGFAGLNSFADAPELRHEAIYAFSRIYFSSRAMEMQEAFTNAWRTVNAGGAASVAIGPFGPNALALTLDNAVDGYLFYSDGYSRHWRAFDNGKEVKVEPANYNFKAVRLARGRHNVAFVFNPSGYKTALILYAVSLSALGSLIAVSAFNARRRGALTNPREVIKSS